MGKQYHLPLYIEATLKNNKWGQGEGNENFGEDNQDLKKLGVGKIIKL